MFMNKNMVVEKDQVVKKETIENINNIVLSESFSYVLSNEKPLNNFLNKKYKTDSTIQMVHVLYKKEPMYKSTYFTPFYNLFNEIVHNVIKKDTELLRMKVNFLFPKTNKKINNFHKDSINIKNYKSMVYYVNDSDGDTVVYNNKLYKIKPKAGKIVYFNGDLFHASNNPIKFSSRIVVNINYKDA